MTEILDRLTAALSDRYQIEHELGAGGMATVYLAQDVKHDRKVALKVLRPELAAVIGAERFLVEIKTTANLQHPNILALYDSGEADSFLFYVMPYIDGESLRDRIEREKQLPIDDAVGIASEVASALDYAHRHDVIHRDIKPENILLHDGRALVADFGIALAVTSAGDTRMTETGMSLGTPHYMSPEQAMGERELDARSDVYALGCVLYEMLTGEPPFTGTTAQAIVARVVTESPRPLIPQRHTIPPHVEATVLKAIEKLPADRFATGALFADALSRPGAIPITATPASQAGGTAARWNPLTAALTALVAILGALLLWTWASPTGRPAGEVIRVDLRLPSENVRGFGTSLALAPDGRAMIRSASSSSGVTATRLWLRRWDRLDEEPIRGVEGAFSPVYSPDGRSVAYTTPVNDLKVYVLGSGTQTTVLDSGMTDVSVRGGGIDWGPDGLLYASGLDGLIRVAPSGGVPEQLTTLDTLRGELAHGWVDVLPNAKGALITIIPRNVADFSSHTVAVADFGSGTVTEIFQGVFARYVPSGHVVFVLADGAMLAAPFDPDRMLVTGEAVPLPDSVKLGFTGAAELAVSASGIMAYLPKRDVAQRLMWVDRTGHAEGVLSDWVAEMANPSLSPDGSRVAVSIRDDDEEGWHVWVRPLNGDPPVRLSYNGASNTRSGWTPDGTSVTYISDQLGPTEIYMAKADGTGGESLVASGDSRPMFGQSWAPDGKWLVLRTDNQAPGRGDILAIRPGMDTVARVLVASPEEELSPSVSPDGRWLAYVSSISGRREIYLREFLGASDHVQRVSRNGGTEPLWSRSGRELFYRSAADSLMSVEVLPGSVARLGRRQSLFSTFGYLQHEFHRNYDIAPNDERFLMVQNVEQDVGLVVVFNWDEELRGLFDN
ncbi:MAG: protein kinase [Gemmatimonadetes bacterium]|nr:protein kinase [Gemmatimonadota bacterium]